MITSYLFVVLPDPGSFPAWLPRNFRLSTLGAQLVLWTGLGVLFGALCELANARTNRGKQTS